MDLTCPACHHTVILPDSGEATRAHCQNCGQAFDPLPASQPAPPGSGLGVDLNAPASEPGQKLAMAALVCSLLFCVPGVTQALAVILALLALIRGGKGRGLAWAALVLALLVAGGWAVALRSSFIGGSATFRTTSYVRTPPGSIGTSTGGDLENVFSDLEQLGLAASAYVRDMGQWPANPEAMVPTYLTALVADRLAEGRTDADEPLIQFIARIDIAQDAPTRVVAYSVRFERDEFGDRLVKPHRWVLLLNGEVRSVDAEVVDAAVAEGRGLGPADAPAQESP